MWRIGCFFTLAVIVFVSLVAIFTWVIGNTLGAGQSPWVTILIGLLVLFVIARVGRSVRQAARPVGDLIEASGKVEAGDFSARVPETGPREVRALARAFNAMSAKLEETEHQRRSALADVSHELRTPLTVIQGNLEALLDNVYPADAEHLQPIIEETRVMERLIEDLRTLTLVEAGSLVLHREPTDLGALLSEIAAGYLSQAAESGVGLTVDGSAVVPPLDIDPARIREVVANLLTNALRHTRRDGTVEISVHLAGGGAEVSIRDTGSGMTEEQLGRVFDRFYRAPDSPGSGLGLPIAQRLVEAHGGTLTATSEVGAGTTVRFTLPTPPEAGPS